MLQKTESPAPIDAVDPVEVAPFNVPVRIGMMVEFEDDDDDSGLCNYQTGKIIYADRRNVEVLCIDGYEENIGHVFVCGYHEVFALVEMAAE